MPGLNQAMIAATASPTMPGSPNVGSTNQQSATARNGQTVNAMPATQSRR